MKKEKNILFLVPDGVGVRNYLYSSVIENLKNKANLVILTTLPKEAIDEVASFHSVPYSYHQFELCQEPLLSKFYREAAKFARLKRNANYYNNPTIVKFNWNFKPKSFKLKVFNYLTRFLGTAIHKNYKLILNFERKAQKSWDTHLIENYKELLLKLDIDTIFITHQRVFSLMPICLAAKSLNINTVSCIYSWDNVPKASLGIWANKFIVWSEYMKNQFSELYPEISKSAITITGTPQFEFYKDENLEINRETFAKLHHLDASKRWICFSGDDEMTSPYDPIYLEDTAIAVRELAMDLQIIFRRCPVDNSNRYDAVIEHYSDVIKVVDPIWYTKSANWGAIFPQKEDLAMLVNIVKHCDLVLNLGSTMAHDFAVYNKPCLYFRYDPVKDKNRSVEDVYNFQHFESMEGLEAVGWIQSKKEINKLIKQALQHPDELGKDRQLWLQKIVKHPLEASSSLVAEELLKD